MGKICIVKERFVKKYRHPELDKKLTKNRILNEVRNLARASKEGINVPMVYFVDLIERKIYMQAVSNSCQLKEILREINTEEKSILYSKLIEKLSNDLGILLAKLHNSEIIHGDLTPSNILLKVNDIVDNYDLNSSKSKILKKQNYNYIYLIDFGLSFFVNSAKAGLEDKAVDLYVLKRAIVSSNPKSEEMFDKILDVYQQNCNNGDKIVEQYRKVEMRGRKKLAFG